jgi:hypothetical protein
VRLETFRTDEEPASLVGTAVVSISGFWANMVCHCRQVVCHRQKHLYCIFRHGEVCQMPARSFQSRFIRKSPTIFGNFTLESKYIKKFKDNLNRRKKQSCWKFVKEQNNFLKFVS